MKAATLLYAFFLICCRTFRLVGHATVTTRVCSNTIIITCQYSHNNIATYQFAFISKLTSLLMVRISHLDITKTQMSKWIDHIIIIYHDIPVWIPIVTSHLHFHVLYTAGCWDLSVLCPPCMRSGHKYSGPSHHQQPQWSRAPLLGVHSLPLNCTWHVWNIHSKYIILKMISPNAHIKC